MPATGRVAPLTGSVDRNIKDPVLASQVERSLPSRGAWIEMLSGEPYKSKRRVAPLTGSVDRNDLLATGVYCPDVAPLTGSVDRNRSKVRETHGNSKVAPLTGSVDRNNLH